MLCCYSSLLCYQLQLKSGLYYNKKIKTNVFISRVNSLFDIRLGRCHIVCVYKKRLLPDAQGNMYSVSAWSPKKKLRLKAIDLNFFHNFYFNVPQKSICLTCLVVIIDLDNSWLQVLHREFLYNIQSVIYWYVLW